MCLSAFVLLSPDDDPTKVLLGMVRPDAPNWVAVGALDRGRATKNQGRWMLPSCHLMLFESPDDAARRILREQLGVEAPALRAPMIVSETYGRGPEAGSDPHWDLHFIYRIAAPSGAPRPPGLWERLEFVDPRTLDPSAFARSHGDILGFAGLSANR